MPTCPKCAHEWESHKKPLTERQRDILNFIEWSIGHRGIAPTFEELAGRFGWRSFATVWEHLDNLERKGWIVRQYNEARAIELVA